MMKTLKWGVFVLEERRKRSQNVIIDPKEVKVTNLSRRKRRVDCEIAWKVSSHHALSVGCCGQRSGGEDS